MNKGLLQAFPGAAHASASGCSRLVDLHVHSVFSDGLNTPAQLCAMAQKAGVSHIALCDHDTADGLPDMRRACLAAGLCLLPGVEVSTGEGGRTHVLCYGSGVESPEMKAFLDGMAQERTGRAQEMLNRLAALGVDIPPPRRQALLCQNRVGRAHIARELIALGVVDTMQQAFSRYLLEGRPAYVPRRQLPTADTVARLRGMNTVPVLAHPMRLGLDDAAAHALIRSLREAGLMGVEAYHPSANARQVRALDGMARREGLLVTGGSDYHGDPGSAVRIGRLPGGWPQREADLSALLSAMDG